MQQLEPTWKMDQQFVVDQHQYALQVDSLNTSVPMSRDVNARSQIDGMLDAITYAKGASILRMMEYSFGSEVFNAALRTYIKDKYEKINSN